MGLFDRKTRGGGLQKAEGVNAAERSGKTETFEFPIRPETLSDFQTLPEAQLSDPFQTAALTVLAFTYYPANRDLALSMLNFLRGPRPLSPLDQQFIRDRFMDKDYVPRSYFDGATPANNYTPAEPWTLCVHENMYSYEEQNYAKLFLSSSGADAPRFVQLRLAKDGKWYLWEQFLLSDVRKPEEQDPWA